MSKWDFERKVMTKGRKVLTTGEVAEICNVASRTVGKWVDGGLLKGYRIPGSRDRRIPIPELMQFMKEYGIPGYDALD
jgi:two-component system response regulator RpaA